MLLPGSIIRRGFAGTLLAVVLACGEEAPRPTNVDPLLSPEAEAAVAAERKRSSERRREEAEQRQTVLPVCPSPTDVSAALGRAVEKDQRDDVPFGVICSYGGAPLVHFRPAPARGLAHLRRPLPGQPPYTVVPVPLIGEDGLALEADGKTTLYVHAGTLMIEVMGRDPLERQKELARRVIAAQPRGATLDATPR